MTTTNLTAAHWNACDEAQSHILMQFRLAYLPTVKSIGAPPSARFWPMTKSKTARRTRRSPRVRKRMRQWIVRIRPSPNA